MYQFNYRKASSVEHAADLRANAEDGVYLAGGMTLIPTLKQRLAAPSDVIDVGGLADLRGIDVGATVRIGALATHAEVAASAEVRGAIGALSDLAEGIGDAHVRNRGTIGGSVANSDPAADYPAAVVALSATVNTNRRSIAGDDFFTDLFETALDDGEIITSVEFPIPARAAYAEVPESGVALCHRRRHGGAGGRRRARWRHGCRAVRLPLIGPRSGAGERSFSVGP